MDDRDGLAEFPSVRQWPYVKPRRRWVLDNDTTARDPRVYADEDTNGAVYDVSHYSET